ILGPIVIVICLIWTFSVFGLGRRFVALVESNKAKDTPASAQPQGATT
ncbi:MAG: hypothetical protein JSS09_00365, partial [Verrucomicrobia bacterium]|nr:hypothetical protein [Verrucomicrobiota bacterium]